MNTQQQIDVVDHILVLRKIIAGAGERDSLGWWDSDALSSAGSYVLQRIFPRSASWAGIRLAIEAATIRHRMILGNQPALSLFALGEEWESQTNKGLKHRYSSAEPPFTPGSVQSPSDLLALFQESDVLRLQGWVAPRPLELFESHAMEVGQVRDAKMLSPEDIVQWVSILAVSYAQGDKGRLVIPYLRVLQS